MNISIHNYHAIAIRVEIRWQTIPTHGEHWAILDARHRPKTNETKIQKRKLKR
jgi:hypothetical protein